MAITIADGRRQNPHPRSALLRWKRTTRSCVMRWMLC